MNSKTDRNDAKTFKVVLFAGLIASIFLSHGFVNPVVAESENQTDDQKKLDRLKQKYEKIQTKIDKLEQKAGSKVGDRIENLKEKQDRIVEKAIRINEKYNISDAESEDVKDGQQSRSKRSSSYGSIDIKSSRIGCDKNTEVAHSYGYVLYGASKFYLTHNFPNPVSTGSFPSCVDYDWDDQLKIYADNIWNTGEGCYGYFSVSSYGTSKFICPGDTFDKGEWWYFETTGYYEGSKAWKIAKQHIL